MKSRKNIHKKYLKKHKKGGDPKNIDDDCILKERMMSWTKS